MLVGPEAGANVIRIKKFFNSDFSRSVYIWLSSCTYAYKYAYFYGCMYVRMYVCMYMYVGVKPCMYGSMGVHVMHASLYLYCAFTTFLVVVKFILAMKMSR